MGKKLSNCTWMVISFLFFSPMAFSQDKEIEKQFEKAEKMVAGNKAEGAEKVLIDLVKKYPWSGEVWDKLAKIQQTVLDEQYKLDALFENMTITTKDAKGNLILNDTLSNSLAKMMKSMKPSDSYRRHMINTFRLACIHTRQAYYASMLTRGYLVDADLNKEVKKEAWQQFVKAEDEFGKKNYNSAAKLYQKSIDLDSNFYKARLYLGDVYYFTKHYDLAIQEFKNAIASQPAMLEPRKYLFDALEQSGAYEKAYDVGVETMQVYPDFTMMAKLEKVARSAGIKCRMGWQSRDVLPNTVKEVEAERDDFTIEVPAKSPWKFYTEALPKVKSFCDENGIIGANDITNEKYLEVYSWKYMLSKTDTSQFKFARQMQKQEMLDCYVFISCFHYNFYPQYLNFIAANKDRVLTYFEELKKMD